MVDFDYDELFDVNTVRIKKENVDVEFIMKKREENLRAKEERMKEKAALEFLEQQKELEKAVKKTEESQNDNNGNDTDEPPTKMTRIEEVKNPEEKRSDTDSPKLSKRKEGKRGQNKKRGQHFEAKMEDKVYFLIQMITKPSETRAISKTSCTSR